MEAWTITDDPEQRRFEIRAAGELSGFVEYRRRPGVVALVHTEVLPGFQGRGVAGRLISGVLERARAAALSVLPLCPYVRDYIAKHDEYLDLVPAARRKHYRLPADT